MTIPEIKSRLPIQTVLSHYGYRPTHSGAMVCPFHTSKPGNRKKTFQVYHDTNRYQCFHKECSAGNGDVIDFIEQQEQCSKHKAIEKAKILAGGTTVVCGATDAQSDGGEEPLVGESRPAPQQGAESGTFFTQGPGPLRYEGSGLEITVLGGVRTDSLERLRVTLKVRGTAKIAEQEEKQEHRVVSLRHSLDLYHDDQVQKLVRRVADRLPVGTRQAETALYGLTDALEGYRLEQLEQEERRPAVEPLSKPRREAALTFLRESSLMERTNALLGKSGIVGEERNRQILWLAYSSRKRQIPVQVICLGASGTGKTYLQEKVGRLIPEEEVFSFTAGTENAFYYLGKYDLCHKLVLVEDLDGAQALLYPLRELQTKGWISKVVPLKDGRGDIRTRRLEIMGPICLSGTTTKERLYEDNANRSLLLHLDGGAGQKEAILAYQRRLSAGKVDAVAEQRAVSLLRDVQRVLEPVRVINPYAEQLQIPAQCFKPLRTQLHYLQFIETVTWYHQYQRGEQVDKETGEVYIETTLEDIRTANGLLREVLLTKGDELSRELRDFFEQLKVWLQSEGGHSFYSKALRKAFRLYPMKAHRYISSLEQYGLLRKCGGNRKQGYEYEVADWGDYRQLQEGMDVLDELLSSIEKQEQPQEADVKYNGRITPV